MTLGDDHESSGGYGGTGQTRTRLPDGPGDGHPGPRRGPARTSSRSLVTIVGVVVLLIAAIAFANRGGDDSAPSSKGRDAPPDTAATAPTGKRPVDSRTAGIPSGYARTEQGAASAAANYAVALGSADMFDKAKRDTVLGVIITPAGLPDFESRLDKAYSPQFNRNIGLNEDGTAPKGYTFVSRTNPIGTRITKSSGDRVTVDVWCGGLLGLTGQNSVSPVTSSWFTITMDLEWADGDWKIVAHSQKDGPAPIPGDDKASSADEMAKAVQEYGGFTYAR
ncbi:hypothetical protein [Streptomyces sp. SHP 1-2]|uniref:hypothetical protein n=1 Tax=Streptomyces sp. SHP 1-2 TaxID=2769489 RepID=UPI002238BE67|nr:hypothetical protein [Streptomyces sp. SHP 1-2]MCW5250675.1 hypothetical protein [Streptomyces sp. SHP 1-2]